jgi:lipopolysaccharide/colanic/teichoic acid biosynthesis glycosyltransferase
MSNMATDTNERICLASSARDCDAADVPWTSGLYDGCKRVPEFVLSAVLLLLAAPVILVLMVFVRLTSRGPSLYMQSRVGLRGHLFTIYKIRTMTLDSERTSGPRWATDDDSRIIPFGRFLRRSHLDELPQLWNIVCGDMSLVGPRPERPEFITILEHQLPRYRDRLSVRPGLTGLAQVQLPPDADVDGVSRKLALDLYYIQHHDFWLDLRLLICTAVFLVGIPFALSCRFLSVPALETAFDAMQGIEPRFEILEVQAEPV